MDAIVGNLIHWLSTNHGVQVALIAAVGKLMQKGAGWLETHKPPDERGKTILGIVVTFLSLITAFLGQYQAGTLNAFDPQPWENFILFLLATLQLITAGEKGKEKLQSWMSKHGS